MNEPTASCGSSTSATVPSATLPGANASGSMPISGAASTRVGVAIGVISLVTIVIGLILPIGMFGFLAAVGARNRNCGAARLSCRRIEGGPVAAPPADLPNGQMVQRFDSYLYRQRAALPAPAHAEIDAISAVLPSLKQTLERVDDLDPDAQDARRLMSIHLPGLIDRYVHVPPAFRGAEGRRRQDRRRAAGRRLARRPRRAAEISEKLARRTWPRSKRRAASSRVALRRRAHRRSEPAEPPDAAHAIEPAGVDRGA